jgi:hypothetical protein
VTLGGSRAESAGHSAGSRLAELSKELHYALGSAGHGVAVHTVTASPAPGGDALTAQCGDAFAGRLRVVTRLPDVRVVTRLPDVRVVTRLPDVRVVTRLP